MIIKSSHFTRIILITIIMNMIKRILASRLAVKIKYTSMILKVTLILGVIHFNSLI